MAVRGLRARFLIAFAFTALAGCSLSVNYEGSHFACDPPAGACPDGFTCGSDGYCAPDRPPIFDAGVVDALGPPPPDAPPGTPDATPPPDASLAVTVTFGERPTSMVQGV